MVSSKILVIDACPINRELYREAFADTSYDLEMVNDVAALRKAAQWWEPDLILLNMDRNQSKESQIVAKIRKVVGRQIPIVLAAPMVQESLQSLAGLLQVNGAYSTLNGMNQIVQTADRVMSDHIPLDG